MACPSARAIYEHCSAPMAQYSCWSQAALQEIVDCGQSKRLAGRSQQDLCTFRHEKRSRQPVRVMQSGQSICSISNRTEKLNETYSGIGRELRAMVRESRFPSRARKRSANSGDEHVERSNSTELAEVSCQVSLGDFGIVFNLRLDISHVAAIITSYGSAPADSALLPFKTDRIGMPPNGRAQSNWNSGGGPVHGEKGEANEKM